VLIGSCVELLLLPAFALVADRVGVRRVAFFLACWTTVFSFPFFLLLCCGTAARVACAVSLALVGIRAPFSVVLSYVSLLFDTRVRYTGLSLAYGIAAGILGGMTPVLTSSLYLWARSSWPIALYVVVVGVISMISVLLTAMARPMPLAAAVAASRGD